MITTAEINQFVQRLDREGFAFLIEAVRHRQNVDASVAAASFRPGDEVTFRGRNRLTVTGVVARVNQRSILVERCVYQNGAAAPNYRVAPTLLTKVAK